MVLLTRSENAPDVLQFLYRLMKVVWCKEELSTSWQRAGEILIPKEKGFLRNQSVPPDQCRKYLGQNLLQ